MSSEGFGYFLAFLAMIAGGFSMFPFTDAARKWGPVAINHFRLLLGLLVLSIVVMLLDKKTPITLFTTPSATEYLYLSLSGVIGLVIGDYFGFHSMAILGAKRASIFYTLAPGTALAFSFVLIGESIDSIGLIGMAISIAGMIWFTQATDTKEIEEHVVHEYGKISKGIFFGVLAGICQGLHMTLAKKAITDESALISPVHATWIRLLGSTVAYFTFTIVTGNFRKNVITPIMKEQGTIIKASLASILGMVLSIVLVMWSLTLCKVAIAQTIISLEPILILPTAYFLYGEKITLKTFIAAIISILGVYVLIWRDEIIAMLGLHIH